MIESLLARGVRIDNPHTVTVDDTVNADLIADDVIIHGGSRLTGTSTSIGPGSIIGTEAPVTINECQLGAGVSLAGGTFSGATFLDGVSFGSGAQVRPGTLLEEQASCAHTVGLKQTVLMPFCVTGSLINFCDALMAGGTGRNNHSEIGSSYVHFNFTPHQDKATASLIGDVPRGVMLDQPPVFLGGQGGLVGPCRIEYGTVVPAGTINRRDILDGGRLVLGQAGTRHASIAFTPGAYGGISRILRNNLIYVGNLIALTQWYHLARAPFMTATPHGTACFEGALRRLGSGIAERLSRLDKLATAMPRSLELARSRHTGDLPDSPYAEQQRFMDAWPDIRESLVTQVAEDSTPVGNECVAALTMAAAGTPYLDAVAGLSPDERAAGTAWLQNIVDRAEDLWTR